MKPPTAKQYADWRKRIDNARRNLANVACEINAARPLDKSFLDEDLTVAANELSDAADYAGFADRTLDRLATKATTGAAA